MPLICVWKQGAVGQCPFSSRYSGDAEQRSCGAVALPLVSSLELWNSRGWDPDRPAARGPMKRDFMRARGA
jgi:hypothetical protein